MNRRDMFRVIGAAAVVPAAAREFPKDFDPAKELARADWKPVFFDAHQNETMIVLSDMVIPATDTPGAREALVNRFIDGVMAVEPPEVQREFLNALGYLDGECMRHCKTAFLHATREQRFELLTFMSRPQSLEMWGGSVPGDPHAYRHFSMLKDWVSRSYYSSEIGKRELPRRSQEADQGVGRGPVGGEFVQPASRHVQRLRYGWRDASCRRAARIRRSR